MTTVAEKKTPTKSTRARVSKKTLDLFLEKPAKKTSTVFTTEEETGDSKSIQSIKKISVEKKSKEDKKNDSKQEPVETNQAERVDKETSSVSEKKEDTTIASSVPETKKEKKSFSLTSMFSGFRGTKEEKKAEAPVRKTITADTSIISEPVRPTPIPQRKLPDEKKLSTFGLSKDRDQFIENLSMLVLSGMSIIGALTSIIKQTRTPGMKLILERMKMEIEYGSPVWKTFDRTGFFKGYTISLIRLGEESGKFAENLKVVALEEEKDREFKSKVRSALMYPIFVLGLTGIVGIGISWFILPKLAKIFTDLKLALPFITKVLLGFGVFLSKHGLIAVPVALVVIGFIAYIIFFNKKTKFIGEIIFFSIPGIKTLLMEVEVARFGYLLGTLLEAGLPVTKALDSLIGASEVIRYKKFYTALKESIELGNSFEKSFANYKGSEKLIPESFQQLIISGEQSGNLNKTLIKVGQVLEAKSDTTTKNLTIIMEPILLVIVWVGVVTVAFAVILPIYSLVGGLNNI